jgi:hypothetical protein
MPPPRKSGSREGGGGAGSEITTPQEYPNTTPPISSTDHSWVLQVTMEIQKSIGQIQGTMFEMRTEIKDHGEKIARFERVFYAVSAVGAILLVVVGFLVNKLWDPVVSALLEYAKSQP